MTNVNKQSGVNTKAQSIRRILGAQLPVLPGESEAEYQKGLSATIAELGAVTPLQIYLAEKIFDCLCWIQRYEIQKRDTLASSMAELLKKAGSFNFSDESRYVMDTLIANRVDEKRFAMLLQKSGKSIESLRQEAYRQSAAVISHLDARIELKLKTLKGFQSSYEALVSRRLHIERLQLQNDLMRRDLQAIPAMVKEIAPDAAKSEP